MRNVAMPCVLGVAAALGVGCGGSAYGPYEHGEVGTEPPGSVDDYARRIERMRGQLVGVLGGTVTDASADPLKASHGSARDCDAAADIGARICELADRICAISERNAADASLADCCDRARVSCEQAGAEIAATCS